MSNTDKPDAGTDYDALSDWAENEMTLPAASKTAKRGRDAGAAGRALLDRVAGRPSLDPDAEPGTESPVRQVRLPVRLDARIDAIAAQQGRSRSAVLRDAVAEYADAHSMNA
ncbi:ribbon-helix-helix domain-containing protein [Rhodococcus sp. H29-C3]|uniref:CopG family ribbon-helix-helix protein n=1 Tax=Rhodococcus sp. H29-C3 TaxID=3046307 RepID=UPI0024B8E9CD|nr:ribbon-helix-helix domain-containing protein [Rhodococcus sp. H29-C3]MDJ0363138.1 ribbon-helix-helix domain-containing protein [Rhodococcus sp. H29-C3]